MTVEFWNSVFQWGSVGLIAVTFLFGAGALWTGNRINARQTARILVLETERAKAETLLTEQQERTAKSELELERLKRLRLPRFVGNPAALLEGLKDRVSGEAVIWYQPNDNEAYNLAWQISGILHGSKWKVDSPAPIPEDAVTGDLGKLPPAYWKRLPPATRVGAAQLTGVAIIAESPGAPGPDGHEIPFDVMFGALAKAELGAITGSRDSALPERVVRIIVLPKP